MPVVAYINFKLCLSATAILILCLAGFAHAADIDLEISTGVGYDSNVFRSAADPEQDAYLKLAPEITLVLPFYRAFFGLSSRGNIQQNLNQTDANLQELILSGYGLYKLSDHIQFRLQDKLVISELLKSAEELTDVPGRRKFTSNRLSSDLRHELKEGVLSLSLAYSNDFRNYTGTEEDWISHAGQLQVEYFLGYKTSTQLTFGLTRKLYETDIDYLSFPITASLKRKLSNKLDASFSLGLKNRRYSGSYEGRNWDEPSVSLAITGRFTPKTASALVFQREVYDSDFALGNAFISKAGILSLALKLNRATQLTLAGLYSRNDYTLFKWTSDVYEGRVAIKYRLFRRGAVALRYGYEKWNTNFLDILGYDYDKHVADLSYVIAF